MPDLLAPLLRANPALNLTDRAPPADLRPADASTRPGSPTSPGLDSERLAPLDRLAELCEERYASGFLERPEAVESVPWADRDLDWLALSLGYLRRVVPALVRVDPRRSPDPA